MGTGRWTDADECMMFFWGTNFGYSEAHRQKHLCTVKVSLWCWSQEGCHINKQDLSVFRFLFVASHDIGLRYCFTMETVTLVETK